MSRFLILFKAPEPMSQFMAQSAPEERQAGLAAWGAWKTEADKTISFEFGAVVQTVDHIGQDGTSQSPDQISNYAFAEARSKDEVVNALQTHPHLERAKASIDVLEVLSMPSQ